MSKRGVPINSVEDLTPRGVYESTDPKYKFVRILKHETVLFIRYYLDEWSAIHGDWKTDDGYPLDYTSWYTFHINPSTTGKIQKMGLRRLNDDVSDIPL